MDESEDCDACELMKNFGAHLKEEKLKKSRKSKKAANKEKKNEQQHDSPRLKAPPDLEQLGRFLLIFEDAQSFFFF